ncbi:LysR family transcriptional regulator [Pararobbsia alpina]|uniref:PCP degradation transcriptional activation protein n=1 Tax=Pararobbsia alpina TaxID=621374 RepID=A0A6S7BDN0_9BURK|nr:LysR family transcriptional regulator [Pararobbsia alpina]CAB3785231.1 PCP degradation transcriptional activation protein [Pararobbsia alpina]
MNLRELDLNLLVVFLEVLHTRGISAAAQNLGLSQPAVSNALARLRTTFDDALFVRTPGGMLPTPLAEELSGPVSSALSQLQDTFNHHREAFDPATSLRRFTIAMTDVAEVYFMPRLTARCAELAPQVRISVVRSGDRALSNAMADGLIDLAIGANNDFSDSYYQQRLFRQECVTVFRIDHELGRSPLTLERFRAARHVWVAESTSPYDRIAQLLEKAGIRARAPVEVPGFLAVPLIVAQGELVATVPRKLADSIAASFGLSFVKPPLKLPLLQTNTFWHRRFHHDTGHRWLRGLIASEFNE